MMLVGLSSPINQLWANYRRKYQHVIYQPTSELSYPFEDEKTTPKMSNNFYIMRKPTAMHTHVPFPTANICLY